MAANCTASPPLNLVSWINCAVLETLMNLVRNPVKDAYWHFCFNMCFAFWKRVYRAYYAVACAMLSSALNTGVVDYGFVASMREELRSAVHKGSDRVVKSAILAFDFALPGIEQASVDVLATQLDELFLFHELTNWDGDV